MKELSKKEMKAVEGGWYAECFIRAAVVGARWRNKELGFKTIWDLCVNGY